MSTLQVSHIGLSPEAQKQMIAGEMNVELIPQGTLLERIRAGGRAMFVETAPDISAAEIRAATEAELLLQDPIRKMPL